MLIEKGKVITNEKDLATKFNEQYVNIVERSCNIKPDTLPVPTESCGVENIINLIISKYSKHPSIVEITKRVNSHAGREASEYDCNFLTNPEEIKFILNSLEPKRAPGIDAIPNKLVKLASSVLAEPLSKAINVSLGTSIFPDKAKIASVIPIDKGGLKKNEISNYRPVSLLNCFCKVYEKIISKRIITVMDTLMSPYLSAYREHFSSQHVLIRLLEEWKEKLDNNYVVGGTLMDLSKAFDCVPHDLLIAKFNAYGFRRDFLLLLYSYLENRMQCVKINNHSSGLLNVLSGVPQGSVLGPILFNVFFNDFFYFFEKENVHNYADDNTLSCFAETIPELVSYLESDSYVAISWFLSNKMIVNPDKFQALIIDKRKSDHSNIKLCIDNVIVKSSNTVKLLGVCIDQKLNFDEHITNICRSAANQLSVLQRLGQYLTFEQKEILVNCYFYSNFNYCPLVWTFSYEKHLRKIDNLQKRTLRLLYNDYYSSYEDLLNKSHKFTMDVNRKKHLAIEIYKTINNLNPCYMKNIFKIRETNRPIRDQYKLNLSVQSHNQVTFGEKSLRILGPKIWNSLPLHVKAAENLNQFKMFLKKWDGVSCKCSVCQGS